MLPRLQYAMSDLTPAVNITGDVEALVILPQGSMTSNNTAEAGKGRRATLTHP